MRYIGIELILYYLVKETLNPDSDKNLTGEPKDFTFGFLDEADIKKIGFCPDRNKPWLTEEKLLEKLRKGNKCFAAKHKDEIAAFTWLNLDEITYPHEKRKLDADEVYLFDLYTMKKYRGKGIAPIIRKKAYEFLRQQGRHKIYSTSEFLNDASIRVKKKLNAEFIHLGIYLRLFRKYHKKWVIKCRGKSMAKDN